MFHKKGIFIIGLLMTACLFMATSAPAKVSADKAAHLGKDLTPMGAERAGNADGSIPAWTGGLTKAPAGLSHKPGEFYQDPFAGEKPLYSITAKNLAKYADKVSAGQQALLKKYPDSYRLDIYPTHRTAAAPGWFYKRTLRNATAMELTKDGLGLVGPAGGVPFPVPNNGNEVILNHEFRYITGGFDGKYFSGTVQANGAIVDGGSGRTRRLYPYNMKNPPKNVKFRTCMLLETLSPPRDNGILLLVKDPINMSKDPRKAWKYFPGMRRVRRAPTVAYDTPSAASSGLIASDEVTIYNGSIDRYNWKLIGKQEMYVPYNNYKATLAKREELLTPHFLNPDLVRWELHRVWVVEATLRKGMRHVYHKRVFYIDEDSWVALGADLYDGHGKLWRVNLATCLALWDIPANVQRLYLTYDLQKTFYAPAFVVAGEDKFIKFNLELPESLFTPEALRRMGRR